MDYLAELSLAFSKARKDTSLSRLIGAKSGDQVKLLTREVPLLWETSPAMAPKTSLQPSMYLHLLTNCIITAYSYAIAADYGWSR